MKKISTAISIIVALFATISCSEKPVIPESTDSFVQVKLGFAGEAPNITTTPMTKADDAKDWYQIQVYSAPVGSTSYSYYGYGFFDSTDNMIINLKEGYQYKFVADMIVDASKCVEYLGLTQGGWISEIGNSFYISATESIYKLGSGYLYLDDNTGYSSYNRPDVDRFYGITEGYVPKEGDSVSINMKRVSFGAKFVAKEFTSGYLEITIEGSRTKTLNSSNGSEIETIVSFNNTANAYSNNDYSENIAVNIIWVKEDGVRTPVVSQDITFVRNHLTTIEFKVTESALSNSFNITADEEWERGETIVAGRDGTNTEVNPEAN